jgi:hypothetical protein
MAIRDRLRQVIESISRPSLATEKGDDTTVEQQQAEKWLEAMQAGRLHPPSDRRDAQGWDRYWHITSRSA